MRKKSLIIGLLIFSVANFSCVRPDTHIYSTWETIELDTCASAWLIKRFVDPEAKFRFYPKGELITEGIPFDTPDAELRCYHNLSTFESIVQKYQIDDPGVIEIGEITHEVEVDFWGKKKKISEETNQAIREIIDSSKDKQECFQRSFIIFDTLYKTSTKLKK